MSWKDKFGFSVEFTGFLCFTSKMADTPESSEHVDAEETSVAEEGANLVDTVDDHALAWAEAEPRGITSIYSYSRRHAYTVIEHGGDQEGF